MDGDLAAAAIAAGGGAPNIGSAIGGSRMTSFTEKGWDYRTCYMFASDTYRGSMGIKDRSRTDQYPVSVPYYYYLG